MYDTWRYVFIGGAFFTIMLFCISIILFFVLRIPNVIGNLSGATARKAIRNIRAQNEKISAVYSGSDITRKKVVTNELVSVPAEETDVLESKIMEDETTVLDMDKNPPVAFHVEVEITYIFSNEVIF